MAIKRTKKTKKNPMSSARRGARSVARQSQGKRIVGMVRGKGR